MTLSIKAMLRKFIITIKCMKTDFGAFGISYKIKKRKYKNNHIKLRQFKDIHRGEKCFIIGTGPSLRIEDIELIKKNSVFRTFGVNTLFKLYDETEWKSDYYCVIDPSTYGSVGENLKLYHRDTLFIPDNRINEADTQVNKFALDCSSFYRFSCPEYFGYTTFGSDLTDEIYDGASVVYAAIQIAVYMGFSEIYLLGVDCNYENSAQLHHEMLSYDEGYKYNWTKRTGFTMIKGFEVAKEYAESHGIKIYNATRGGMLEVFPRINLNEVLEKC